MSSPFVLISEPVPEKRKYSVYAEIIEDAKISFNEGVNSFRVEVPGLTDQQIYPSLRIRLWKSEVKDIRVRKRTTGVYLVKT